MSSVVRSAPGRGVSNLALAGVVVAVGAVGILVGVLVAPRIARPTPASVVVNNSTPPTPPSPPPAKQEVVQAPLPLELAPAPQPPRPEAPKPAPEAQPQLPRAGVLKANVEPAGRYKVGEVLNQEVVFTRKSAYRTLGVEAGQGAQYALTSAIRITKVKPDGTFVAEQTIIKGILIDADAELKPALEIALTKAENSKFELTISQAGEVTSVTGLKDPIEILKGKVAGPGQSLRLWSLLDADAWKELAGLVFLQPAKPLKPKETWQLPVAHDWGPLGTWKGKTMFVVAVKPQAKQPLERIDYKHEIYYKAPTAEAAKELPFQVLKAEFQPVIAGGAILYDPTTQRSTTAEETFRVRGSVRVSIASAEALIEMEEHQTFRLTMLDKAPRELVGKPATKGNGTPK